MEMAIIPEHLYYLIIDCYLWTMLVFSAFYFLSIIIARDHISINIRIAAIFLLFAGIGLNFFNNAFLDATISLAAALFFGLSVYMLWKRIKRFRILATICIFLLSSFAAVIYFKHFLSPNDSDLKQEFNACGTKVVGVADLEQKYFEEHKKYTKDFYELAKTARAHCKKYKRYCGIRNPKRYKGRCRSLSIDIAANGFYQIKGVSGGMDACEICATPLGVNRDKRPQCADPSQNDCIME